MADKARIERCMDYRHGHCKRTATHLVRMDGRTLYFCAQHAQERIDSGGTLADESPRGWIAKPVNVMLSPICCETRGHEHVKRA